MIGNTLTGWRRTFAALLLKRAQLQANRSPVLSHRRPRYEDLESRELLSANSADFNVDLIVESADLVIWKNGFELTGVAAEQGDADLDGDVDGADFLTWQRQLGPTFSPIAKDVYFVGNSLTGGLRITEALRPFVNAQGHQLSEAFAHRNDFAQIVSGASLSWHWFQKKINTSPAEYYIDDFGPELRGNTWDTLVLQPFNKNLYDFNTTAHPDDPKFETWKPRPREEGVVAMANNFIDMAAHHDDLRVVIYQSWPTIPSLPDSNLPDFAAFDFQIEWEDPNGNSVRTSESYAELVETLRQQWGDVLQPQIVMAPTGDVLYELNQRLRSEPFTDTDGEIYDDVEDFYGDRIHLRTGIGRYLMMLTLYSVVYQQDPRGLPIGNYNNIDVYNLGFQSSFRPISQPMQNLLQETVWDVVSTHTYTGFQPDNRLAATLWNEGVLPRTELADVAGLASLATIRLAENPPQRDVIGGSTTEPPTPVHIAHPIHAAPKQIADNDESPVSADRLSTAHEQESSNRRFVEAAFAELGLLRTLL